MNGNGECIKETTTQPLSVKAGGECYKNDAFDHICSKIHLVDKQELSRQSTALNSVSHMGP